MRKTKKSEFRATMIRCMRSAFDNPYPGIMAAFLAVGVLHSVSYVLRFRFLQYFFNCTESVIRGEHTIFYAVTAAIILGGCYALSPVLNGIHNFMSNAVVTPRIIGNLETKMHEKTARIAPICFEDPAFLDQGNKAKNGIYSVYSAAIIEILILFFYLPYLIAVGVYLWSLKPVFVIALLLLFIPLLLTQIVRMHIYSDAEDKAAPYRRRYEYYERCITDREYFKETRMLGGFGFFRQLYMDALVLFGEKTWNADKKAARTELLLKIPVLIGFALILLMAVLSLVHGEISAGSFAALYSAIGMTYGVIQEVVCGHIGEVARNMGLARNYISYMDMPERGGKNASPDMKKGIQMHDVSFTYPGRETSAVSHVNLEIRHGETIAIVGENGSGKSTLVRLMTGLYEPTEGSVMLGGCDTSRTGSGIYSGTSAVFQHYRQYKMTLRENVAISSADVGDDVRDALHKADLGLPHPSFADNEETMLGKEFGGADLSGGQWQRIAIARGLYRAHDFIVLDEPTAAIDPIEETRLYRKFADMTRGKTSVIVTHRLGSARIADRIIVMDRGQIAESGTHDELMAREGTYAEMFRSQAHYYA